MATTPTFFTPPSSTAGSGLTFVNADSTTAKTLFTFPVLGGKLLDVLIASDDTATVTLQFWRRQGATSVLIDQVSVPPGSGIAGVAPVSFVSAAFTSSIAVMPNLADGIPFASGDLITVAPTVAVTAAKTVSITPYCVSA